MLRPSFRSLLRLLPGLAVLVLAGCHRDEITSYRVPRAEKAVQRLLGAVIPHGDKTWFVKLSGPDEAVKEQEDAFERFVKSIHFPDKGDRPIAWTVPPDWKEVQQEKPGRFATLQIGPEEHALEATVTALGRQGQAGDVLANVNRWRGQVGLEPVPAGELAKVTQQLKLDGAEATVVNVAGTGPGRMAMKAHPVEERPHDHEPALERPPLTYETPPGWQKLPADAFRVAAFRVTEGGEEAQVTVIPLPGPAGGLLANVNRWRGQLGLDAIGPEQLKDEVHALKVAGAKAPYVDLTGPGKAGGPPQRLLAVSLDRGGRTWFFKMSGPPELVGRHKAAFEAFVTSVQFGGGGNER